MTLNRGDVLLVGVPEGAPRVEAGDRLRIEIDQVGRLENTVVSEDEWVVGRDDEKSTCGIWRGHS